MYAVVEAFIDVLIFGLKIVPRTCTCTYMYTVHVPRVATLSLFIGPSLFASPHIAQKIRLCAALVVKIDPRLALLQVLQLLQCLRFSVPVADHVVPKPNPLLPAAGRHVAKPRVGRMPSLGVARTAKLMPRLLSVSTSLNIAAALIFPKLLNHCAASSLVIVPSPFLSILVNRAFTLVSRSPPGVIVVAILFALQRKACQP